MPGTFPPSAETETDPRHAVYDVRLRPGAPATPWLTPSPVSLEVTHACAKVEAPVGLHADRAARRYRHHRHFDRAPPPRRPEGARGRRPHELPEQPPSDRPGRPFVSRRGGHLPLQHAGQRKQLE